VKSWAARVIGVSCAALVGVGGAAALAAPAQAATTANTAAANTRASAPAATGQVSHVILIGISGLDWADISQSRTPALWQLAEHGSVGSLVVSAVRTFTCPADAWLTVNSGARATATGKPEPCSLPPVVQSAAGASGTAPARVPAMNGAASNSIEKINSPYSYGPCWGVLAGTNATAATCPAQPAVPYTGCTTAIGPGAALALSSPAGDVQNYAADLGGTPRSLLAKCPLTVVDLGSLPASVPGSSARSVAVSAASRQVARIVAAAPAGTVIVVAGLGDVAAPHVHAIIVSGAGFSPGLLKAASTRQPGMVASTDLTPTILHWLGRGYGNLIGSVIQNSGRGTLASAITMLKAQDTAAQVYRDTLGWFFLIYGVAEGLAFGLVALTLRGDGDGDGEGDGEERRRRRVSAYRIVGISCASVPAGSFLASLVPWSQFSHPALVFYGLALAWSAVVAIVALTGPWRRDPLGSAGCVGAITTAIIAIDVITGSHLQLSTPFGLPVLVAGRFYGIGNNALGPYAVGGLMAATWAGAAALRGGWRADSPRAGSPRAGSPRAGSLQAGSPRAGSLQAGSPRAGSLQRALAAAGVIAIVVLLACATPAWGAKVGGTIAMTPAFLLLLAAIAGIRITPLRVGLIAVSGLVVITAFAVLSYIYPAVGVSDISAFVGHVIHGSAGPILNRKASANLHSVTETWFTPVVPLVVALFGLMIIWPERLRLRMLARAIDLQPLLRPLLTAIWTAGVLGWLADDSGVSVTAAMLPLALPLVIVIVTLAAEPLRSAAPEGHSASDWAASGPVQTPGRQG
jgi:hypothetical protein